MAQAEPRHYSVSSLTAELKSALESRFTRIYVEAEISGWRLYPSGHAYFTLKDAGAQISAVMFKASYDACLRKHPGIVLKDGVKVLVYGDVTVYEPRGNYQLKVLAAKLVGEGDLMRQYLELKAKLEAEGLFDGARKRPLPYMPRRIGIVTSEAGAVIHDMCTVLTRRFPLLEIRLYPCQVQGAAAPATIIAGIRHFNSSGVGKPGGDGGRTSPREWIPDLLIIARGGGSFEDLFCFNDEALVREVAASRIPTISAVGHETDYTLCDFAADKRAGTPSIAAEIAVPELKDLRAQLESFGAQLLVALRGRGEFFAQRTDQLSDSLDAAMRLAQANARHRLEKLMPRLSASLIIARENVGHRIERLKPRLSAALTLARVRAEQRMGGLSPRLETALRMRVQQAEARLANVAAKLTAYSPYGVLERGYSLTTAADGSVVRDAAALKRGDRLITRFAKGTATSTVE